MRLGARLGKCAGMFQGRRKTRSLIRVLAMLCVSALAAASPARADTLAIENLTVAYNTRDIISIAGTVEFDIVFKSFSGSPRDYDLFSVQVLLRRQLAGPSAVLTLDALATEDPGAIGSAYRLNTPPTGNENASIVAAQFRFEDFVSVLTPEQPDADDVLAHYVVHFLANSTEKLGTYVVEMGDPNNNRFGRYIINTFPTTFDPVSFQLVPEPASLIMLLVGAMALARRRRRASVCRSPRCA